MFFKTKSECEEFCRLLGFDIGTFDAKQLEYVPGTLRFSTEGPPTHFSLAKLIVAALGEFPACLLWVTEFGIWPNSQNDHLYYRLRASYGDSRELHVAPGHLFLRYESSDLISFLHLALQFGWGAHLICPPGWTCSHVFVSHDGWGRIKAEPTHRDTVTNALEAAGVPYDLEE